MRHLLLPVLCACGLGLTSAAHAGTRGLEQELASTGNQLMSAITTAGNGAHDSDSNAHTGSSSAGDSCDSDRVGADSSAAAPPSGDMIGVPVAPSHNKTDGGSGSGSGGGHGSGKSAPVLGWQSLLPGSIQ